MKFEVWNATRQCEVASRVELARTGAVRRRGLLGKDSLAAGEGLWLFPCESIHTFFMRFAIDLIYLDRHYRVKKCKRAVPPWRISVCLSAYSVIELAAGGAQSTQRGDQLEMQQRL